MQIDLIIAEWNANGISNHINEVELFLNYNHIDVLLLSETHLTTKSFLRIKGYDLITANHPDDTAHGGAAVLIKKGIKYETLDSITEKYLQAAGVKVVCGNNNNVSIYSVYYPPRFSIKCDNYENFFKKLGNKFIVGGDFNAKHIWWGSRLNNPKGKELYKCVIKNCYKTTSTGRPTYWPSDPTKIPDLLDFFVYKGISDSHLSIAACDDLSSDHTPILLNYKAVLNKHSLNEHIFNNTTNITSFKDYIDKNINLNTSLKTGYELDDAVEALVQLIYNAAFYSTPPMNENKQSNILVSLEIRHLIKAKRRLRKIWQRTRLPTDKRNFNRAAQQLKRRLKQAKNDSVGRYLSKLSPLNNNEYNLYKATKYLKRPQKRNISLKDSDGTWCRSDGSIANAYKAFLEETFSPFSFSNITDSEKISCFLDSPCQMCLPIKPFTVREVEEELKKLNGKKAPGYDKINAKVLQALPKKGLVFLTIIFNAILRLSHYPSQWKYAKIIMVLKPNKPENVLSSYRPISLLPICSKLFERLFQNRLFPILEALNVMPEHQFGFRQNHGAAEQCHRVVKVIRDSLENKLYCASIFLDVKQAFDRVWHDGLLFKIKQLLPTPYFLLLKSYLSQRRFYVCVNNAESEIGTAKAGVPQGSVLGPILYTLFTSDMPVSTNVTTATYADDTAILVSSPNPVIASSILQGHLDQLQTWFNSWNIKVNPEKSTNVTFTLRAGDCPPLLLNGDAIPTSNSVNYLGLRIDRRLTWKDHITCKRKQVDIKTKKMYWLLGPKSQLSLENKVTLYKTTLKPVWSYGIEIWGTASKSNIEILQRYQSKTLRLLSNAPWFVNNDCIHNDLGVPKIADEIIRFSTKYLSRLSNHSNILAINLLDDSNEVNRLKRKHILDLPFLK